MHDAALDVRSSNSEMRTAPRLLLHRQLVGLLDWFNHNADLAAALPLVARLTSGSVAWLVQRCAPDRIRTLLATWRDSFADDGVRSAALAVLDALKSSDIASTKNGVVLSQCFAELFPDMAIDALSVNDTMRELFTIFYQAVRNIFSHFFAFLCVRVLCTSYLILFMFSRGPP